MQWRASSARAHASKRASLRAAPTHPHVPMPPPMIGTQAPQQLSWRTLHPAPGGRQEAESELGPTSSESGLPPSTDVDAAGSVFGLVALAVIEVDMTARKAASKETMIMRAFSFDECTLSSLVTKRLCQVTVSSGRSCSTAVSRQNAFTTRCVNPSLAARMAMAGVGWRSGQPVVARTGQDETPRVQGSFDRGQLVGHVVVAGDAAAKSEPAMDAKRRIDDDQEGQRQARLPVRVGRGEPLQGRRPGQWTRRLMAALGAHPPRAPQEPGRWVCSATPSAGEEGPSRTPSCSSTG
jgi:hypothetical protein